MKAAVIVGKGEMSWQEVAKPSPGRGHVLVKTCASAVNRADLMQCDGNYPPPPGWPTWPGLEMSGRVEAVGEGCSGRWKAGDEVCALLGGGGYAEYSVIPEGLLMRVPKGVPLAEAAALPEVFATACLDLKFTAGVKPGERVLVVAGASGLGLAMIQLAHLYGASVIATAGTPEKEAIVREFGAEVVVNHRRQPLHEALAEHPADVAVDCVGTYLETCIDKMNVGARWILVACMGGPTSPIPLAAMYKRNLTITGITLRSRPEEMKARILRELEANVWPAIEDGRIRRRIHAVFPMSEANAAHAVLRAHANAGKVLLTCE